MFITPSMPYERIEVELFDLFKAGRLDHDQIQIVLGIKSAIKKGRVISDAQAWRARQIVAEVVDDEPVIDEGDTDNEEGQEQANDDYAEF